MKATIKSIHIENFKGVKDKTFDFDNVPRVVTGRNASGKTTIATAYYWLFTDKDIDLNSNPDVKPLDVAECQPTVTVTMTIDGKEVEFTKAQKIKCSKPDENGVVKSSATNTYMINSVPKREAEFKSYLEEIGFPTGDNFLVMSHTDVFSNMKNADMRKALFDMVTEVSDKDIADKLGTVPDLSALLDNYKLEEVLAMNKATIKKCNEQIESIPSQIEGLELAKTEDVDTAEYELQVNGIKEEISNREDTIRDLASKQNEKVEIGKELLRLDFDRSTELQNMEKAASSGREDIEKAINKSCNELVDLKRRVNVNKADISQLKQKIESNNKRFEELKGDYDKAKALVFDDSKAICPCCGQAYPEDKKSEIKAQFEADKKLKMDKANHEAQAVLEITKQIKEDLAQCEKSLSAATDELEVAEKENANLNKQLEDFKPTEVKPTERLAEIDSKIAELTAKKESMVDDYDSLIADEKAKLYDLKQQIDEINKLIGASSNNVRIDEQIEDLQNKQIELEQTKADCEKILFQVDLLAREKNNIVAEEINSYFDVVEFKLWELQKNGVIKDCCIPQYKGKSLGVATNSALEKLMQIDICTGFQKFNEVSMPIFIDQAELFSSDTYNSLECKTQHIYLKVTDGDLEVK